MSSGSPFAACLQRIAERRRVAAGAAERLQHQSKHPVQNTTTTTNPPYLSVAPVNPKKKRTQNVLTIAQRMHIVQWMITTAEQDGPKHIASKAVKAFPLFFRTSTEADNMRALRLWRSRDQYQLNDGSVKRRGVTSCVTRNTIKGLKMVRLKAREGRGRKREAWVEVLHIDLRAEFDRLRRVGVKFSFSTLRLLTLKLLSESTNGVYGSNLIDNMSGMKMADKINTRWIQSFADRYRIVSRTQSGKLQISPAKQLEIEQEVARHLGRMKQGFENGDVDENNISNADETHFIFNMDNGKTLGFCGDEEVRYADVTSGGEGMTMLVRLSGGPCAKIEPPLMIFKNRDRNYPIRGTPDNVPGVSYRTGPKGWMDTTIMKDWLQEPRVIMPLSGNRLRYLFIDNCSGHILDENILAAAEVLRTTINYFFPNATDLIQPCDSFIIQKIKDAWRKRWDEHKLSLLRNNAWTEGGRLPNPGKAFFLRLAAASVADVNAQRDENGISYARKAMIICGLALNTNGRWEERQLKPELQNIINKHRALFENPDDIQEST